MNIKLAIILLCFSNLIYSQEKWTYQSDSIYKSNKVKARKWFNGKKLTATTFYDNEGRMIKFQHESFLGGEQRTTYFEYNEKGDLIKQVDTTRNGKPDKKALKKLKKMGLDLSSKMKSNKPEIEVSTYEINYADGKLLKLTHYNPDNSLNIVDHYKNNGKTQIRDWYRNGKIYRQSTTEYLDDFQKEKYFGWEIRPNSDKSEWNYTFEYVFENGHIKEFTRFDNGEKKETTKMEYDNSGLLVKASYYTTERFEYEYYK
jgi:antitoxin component YwqK of YwqJK toxin-antitoxin module|tara:strand:- start:125 stop:898 length:774 start_codon:yes stop_codon:yes gene_type:complete